MYKIPISGGPHSGKTTLIEALAGEFPDAYFVKEAATEVITRQQAKAKVDPSYNPILPWRDYQRFAPLVLAKSLVLEAAVPEETKLVFLDRSLIDTIGYARLNQTFEYVEPTERLVEDANYSMALFCEPVGTYTATEGRGETEEEAKLTHDMLSETYRNSGLGIVHLPAVSVVDRVGMVREAVDRFIR